MPDNRRLKDQIELGRRLMSSLGTVADQANLSAYVTELEAKLQQADDDEEYDDDC